MSSTRFSLETKWTVWLAKCSITLKKVGGAHWPGVGVGGEHWPGVGVGGEHWPGVGVGGEHWSGVGVDGLLLYAITMSQL